MREKLSLGSRKWILVDLTKVVQVPVNTLGVLVSERTLRTGFLQSGAA